MNQIQQHNENPFANKGLPEHVNAGTVSIEEQRAIAEVQGKIIVAKKFPRNAAAAYDKVMQSCSRLKLAESSMYSFPRGKEIISGPSIRLAEELARAWGNIDYGIRELSQKDGVSEMEAYCWDMETNVVSSQKFTVKHERHTKSGITKLTDPRDIYELTANNAGRRLRARILAILPPDLIEGAVDKCNETLKSGNGSTTAQKITRMLTGFATLSVTPEMIEERLQKKTAAITDEEIVELGKVFISIKENITTVADWFNKDEASSGDDNVDELRKELAAPKTETPAVAPAAEKPAVTPKPEKVTKPAGTGQKKNTTAEQEKARTIVENSPGPETAAASPEKKEEFIFTPTPDEAVAGMPPIFDTPPAAPAALDLSEEI